MMRIFIVLPMNFLAVNGCSYTMYTDQDTTSSNNEGVVEAAGADLSQCYTSCDKFDACTGFVYNAYREACFLRASDASVRTSRIGYNFYARNNQSCKITDVCQPWLYLQGNGVTDGASLLDSRTNTTGVYLAGCAGRSDCSGIVYRNSDSNCKLLNRAGGAPKYDVSFSFFGQFMAVKTEGLLCDATGSYTLASPCPYSVFLGRRSWGKQQTIQAESTDLRECFAYCDSLPICTSFQYDAKNGRA